MLIDGCGAKRRGAAIGHRSRTDLPMLRGGKAAPPGPYDVSVQLSFLLGPLYMVAQGGKDIGRWSKLGTEQRDAARSPHHLMRTRDTAQPPITPRHCPTAPRAGLTHPLKPSMIILGRPITTDGRVDISGLAATVGVVELFVRCSISLEAQIKGII